MRTFIVLAFLVLAGSASASGMDAKKPLAVAAITEQQAQIRSEVQAGTGRYKDMSPAKRSELLAKQQKLLATLDGKVSADDLTDAQRTEVFNTLEWIEAAVNNDEDDRMVCTYERTIGSNRKARVCKTEAQIRQQQDESRRRVDNDFDVLGSH